MVSIGNQYHEAIYETAPKTPQYPIQLDKEEQSQAAPGSSTQPKGEVWPQDAPASPTHPKDEEPTKGIPESPF